MKDTNEADFLKPEETEETKGNEIKNNDTWIKVATIRERWKEMKKRMRNDSSRNMW